MQEFGRKGSSYLNPNCTEFYHIYLEQKFSTRRPTTILEFCVWQEMLTRYQKTCTQYFQKELT
jgi:hypothetical protein